MKYKEYKFRDVYEFANIINKLVEYETEFWAYDERQFINASVKYNKISLLHIYIYTQLLNYYNREYFKNGDCYEDETYDHWKDVAASYNIIFRSEFNERYDSLKELLPWIFSILSYFLPWIFSIFGKLFVWIISIFISLQPKNQ